MAFPAHGNFVINIAYTTVNQPNALHDTWITNAEILADIASGPRPSTSPSLDEISIGAGFTIRLGDTHKLLHRDGCVHRGVTVERLLKIINDERNAPAERRVQLNFSEHYGLHMSLEHSFQFYKRTVYPDSDDGDDSSEHIACRRRGCSRIPMGDAVSANAERDGDSGEEVRVG